MTESPTETPTNTVTSTPTTSPTTTATPTITETSTAAATNTPDSYELSVVVEVDETPLEGSLIRFSGQSGATDAVVLESDENGEVVVSVSSSDFITIESALDAIEFPSRADFADTLHSESPLLIAAERVLEVVGMCRLAIDVGQDDLLFSIFNRSSENVELLGAPYRNEIRRLDGSPLGPAPPELFSAGTTLYSVPVEQFRDEQGDCTGGVYTLLDKETAVMCSSDTLDIDVALCQGDGVLPCSEIRPNVLKKVLRRAVRGFFVGRRAAADLRRRFPGVNSRFSIEREASRAITKIEGIISDTKKKIATCSEEKVACSQIPFPKDRLRDAFLKGFRPRPPTGRKSYRAMIRRMERRFNASLRAFPAMIVVCGD